MFEFDIRSLFLGSIFVVLLVPSYRRRHNRQAELLKK
jgi:hypothetical protein